MEGDIGDLEQDLVKQERGLSVLMKDKLKLEDDIKRSKGADSDLKKALREKEHEILVRETDICMMKTRIKQRKDKIAMLTREKGKIAQAAIDTELQGIKLEENIKGMKSNLDGVEDRIKKNQEVTSQTEDILAKLKEREAELKRDIEKLKKQSN